MVNYSANPNPNASPQNNNLRNEVYDYINLRLGGSMVDTDMNTVDFQISLDQALRVFREQSSTGVEESYMFLALSPEVSEYTLPDEVITVRDVIRRSIGASANSSSTEFEPFEAGYLNMYMLENGRIGGLLNYELFSQYQELAARMFGGYINFKFNSATKKLTLVRKLLGSNETVMLWCYNYKPDIVILADPYTSRWVRDYALAVAKSILGQARSKYSVIPGPNSSGGLNGTDLIAQSKEEITFLEDQLKKYVGAQMPLSFVIG